MATRTFISKSGDTWEWEETPEVLEALKKLYEIQNDTKSKTVG